MMSFKSFKILMLGFVFLLSQELFADAICSQLFGSKPAVAKTEKSEVSSRVQSEEWLKKKLFEEGWLEKIRKADYQTTQIELFSEMLYETTQILLKEFYRQDSELSQIPGAERYLRGIVRDIKAHRTEYAVTKKYFLEINWIIANFISLKHNKDASSKYLREELARDSSERRIDSMITSERAEFSTIVISETLRDEGLKKDVVLIPTFAELSIESFIEMGIIEGKILPIGMTLETNNRYDGTRGKSAREYFVHDLLHAREIVRARIALIKRNKDFNLVMRKASERYKEYRKTLDTKARELMDVILFGFSHEQEIAALYEFLKPNGKPSWEKFETETNRKSLIISMMYFVRRDFNYEGKDSVLIDLVKDEFGKFVSYYKAKEKEEPPPLTLKMWIQSKFFSKK